MDKQPKPLASIRAEFSSAALFETARGDIPFPDCSDLEDGAAEAEINAMFRRKLMGLRHLPRHERAGALKAAREWRAQALKALRDHRSRERQARYMLWRLQRPAPRQPG